jgi:hypothetical protein
MNLLVEVWEDSIGEDEEKISISMGANGWNPKNA